MGKRVEGTGTTDISYVYIANRGDNSISILKLDTSGDDLDLDLVDTFVPDSSMTPEILRANAAGTLLYATENAGGGNMANIRVMTVDADTGALTTQSTLPLLRDTYYAKGLGFDRTGKFLFVSHYVPSTDTLFIPVAVGSGGTHLSEGAAVDVTGEIMTSPQGHPTLNRIYSASLGTNEVMNFGYSSSTGAVQSSSALASGGSQPRGVAVHPDGDFLVAYHGSGSSVLNVIPVDGVGDFSAGTTVTQSRSFAANYWYYDFVFHPTLDVAYGVALGPELIAPFAVDTSANTLTELGSSVSTGAAGANPTAMAIDASGRYGFVANYGADAIAVFALDAKTGVPTLETTVTVGDMPASIQIVPAN